MACTPPAGARDFGGHRHARAHAHAHVNRNVSRHANVNRNINRNVNVNRNVTRNVNRRYVYRNGHWGYWRNGVWIVAPVVGYAATCAYEYGRWQATGSTYWRDRYYQCAN
jgi:hypothetical protein